MDDNTENTDAAVEYVSKYLALLLNNLIFCYDVSTIVLDGHVVDILGNRVIEETQKKLDKICYKSLNIKKRKVVSPGIAGGALLASNAWLEELFNK